jgi:hypothetical protein
MCFNAGVIPFSNNHLDFQLTRFRAGFTQQPGHVPARVLEARVLDTSSQTRTVTVITSFDKHRFMDIQAASPYLHYAEGEGFDAIPEVGARCLVCIPSDSSPPIVLAFVAPPEQLDTAAEDAPEGTVGRSTPGYSTTSSYGGGRPPGKPGDIRIRGRNGNFLVLHRGGSLQIGASPMAQTVYVPLRNLMALITGEFELLNPGGAIHWGIQPTGDKSTQPVSHTATYRVYANDKAADIRVSTGKVYDPVEEPFGDAGEENARIAYGIGPGVGDTEKDNSFLVYEVVLAPGGFLDNGETTGDIRSQVKLKFFIDRRGGVFFKAEQNAVFAFRKKLLIKAQELLRLQSEQLMEFVAKTGMNIDAGEFFSLKAKVLRLGEGMAPAAAVGDFVQVILPTATITGLMGVPPAATPFTAVITVPTPMTGSIISGRSTVLV